MVDAECFTVEKNYLAVYRVCHKKAVSLYLFSKLNDKINFSFVLDFVPSGLCIQVNVENLIVIDIRLALFVYELSRYSLLNLI